MDRRITTENPLFICLIEDIKSTRSEGFYYFLPRYELGSESHLYYFFCSPDDIGFSLCKYFCIDTSTELKNNCDSLPICYGIEQKSIAMAVLYHEVIKSAE